ncbi:uncharacterized protein TNCV_541781 [Trichonephila clavipes]|nr:uncharacterized protein TNCV_541781 [Trichonephila clavipes]
MSSSLVPLKTHRVGQRCTLNLSRAETSSHWCGVVVRRAGCQLRRRPRHLTMVQNDVVRRQKPSFLGKDEHVARLARVVLLFHPWQGGTERRQPVPRSVHRRALPLKDGKLIRMIR